MISIGKPPQEGQFCFLMILDFFGGVNDPELESEEQGVPTVLSGHCGLLDVGDRVGFCNIKGRDECKSYFLEGGWRSSRNRKPGT